MFGVSKDNLYRFVCVSRKKYEIKYREKGDIKKTDKKSHCIVSKKRKQLLVFKSKGIRFKEQKRRNENNL